MQKNEEYKINKPTTVRFRPIGDKVLVQPAGSKTKTATGIIIPDQAQRPEKYGQVIAKGPGYRDAMQPDKITPGLLNVGDTILLPEYGGVECTINGTGYILIEESMVLGVLENAEAIQHITTEETEVARQLRDHKQA
jgi:chaperonin GroES